MGLRETGDIGGLIPAGNMASTVEDLARFAKLQFRTAAGPETPGLAGTTLKEMQRIHWLEPGWQASWGLGFRIFREDGRVCFGHGGLVPGHAADVHLLPAEKIAIIVLSNAEDAWPSTPIRVRAWTSSLRWLPTPPGSSRATALARRESWPSSSWGPDGLAASLRVGEHRRYRVAEW